MSLPTETETDRATVLAMAKDLLVAQRDDILETITQRHSDDAPTDSGVTDGLGETEHLIAAEQRDTDARLDAISRAALTDIDAALARIEAGTYGLCVECNQEILAARLEVLPATPYCVSCQQLHERS